MPVQPIIPPEWGWAYNIAVGQDWPQADEDALRRLAQAWTDAMEALITVADGGNVAAQNVNYSVQAISSDEFNNYWSTYVDGDNSAVGQMARQCESLATQLLAFAEQTEFTKLSIDIQIILLIIQLAIDFVMAFVTFGASTSEGVLAAFITRLTIRGFLTELLKAVIMAVLPDVITQTIMLAEGHRSSFDVGETLQAAQMGAIGGLAGGLAGKLPVGELFGSVAGKVLGEDAGKILASDAGKFAADATTAAVHGALTNVGTNLAAGGVDSVENQIHAALDPQYAQELRQQTQDQGYADQKSGENLSVAALNGAFTGALFHTVHEGSSGLAGKTFDATPLTLTDSEGNKQQFIALPIRDGSDSNYALFDENHQFIGKGTFGDNNAITVTPRNGSSYDGQVVTFGDQKFAPAGPTEGGGTPTATPEAPTQLASEAPPQRQPSLLGSDHPGYVLPVQADQQPAAVPEQPAGVPPLQIDQPVQTPPPAQSPDVPVTGTGVPRVDVPASQDATPTAVQLETPTGPESVPFSEQSAPVQVPAGGQPGEPGLAGGASSLPVGLSGATELSAVPVRDGYGIQQEPIRKITPPLGEVVPEQLAVENPIVDNVPEAFGKAFGPLKPEPSEFRLELSPEERDALDKAREAKAAGKPVPPEIAELAQRAERARIGRWGNTPPPDFNSEQNKYMRFLGQIVPAEYVDPATGQKFLATRLDQVPKAEWERWVAYGDMVSQLTGREIGIVNHDTYVPGTDVRIVLGGDTKVTAGVEIMHWHPFGYEYAGRASEGDFSNVAAGPDAYAYVRVHVSDDPGSPWQTVRYDANRDEQVITDLSQVTPPPPGPRDGTVEQALFQRENIAGIERRAQLGSYWIDGALTRDGWPPEGFRGDYTVRQQIMLAIDGWQEKPGVGLQFTAEDRAALRTALRHLDEGHGAFTPEDKAALSKLADHLKLVEEDATNRRGALEDEIRARGGSPQPASGPTSHTVDPFEISAEAPTGSGTGHGETGWTPGAAEQELANRVPKITADQFFKMMHEGTSEPYAITYDNQRAVFKAESMIWRDRVEQAWLGDDLHRQAWPDASLWSKVPIDELRYPRELAAYSTDQMLGFDLVPTTAKASFGIPGVDGVGSLQEFVVGGPSQPANAYQVIDQQRMAVLDYVTANNDRHGNNFITGEDGRPVAIDNGETFPPGSETPDGEPWTTSSNFVSLWKDRPLNPQVLERVRAVDPHEFADMLRARGIGEPAIEGAVGRLTEIQQHGMITGEAFGGDYYPPEHRVIAGQQLAGAKPTSEELGNYTGRMQAAASRGFNELAVAFKAGEDGQPGHLILIEGSRDTVGLPRGYEDQGYRVIWHTQRGEGPSPADVAAATAAGHPYELVTEHYTGPDTKAAFTRTRLFDQAGTEIRYPGGGVQSHPLLHMIDQVLAHLPDGPPGPEAGSQQHNAPPQEPSHQETASGGQLPKSSLAPQQVEGIERVPTVPLSWDQPRVFTDTGEAVDYAEQAWSEAISQLTPEQKAALMAYTGEAIVGSGDQPSYHSINRYLRGRIPAAPEILDSIARIDEALRLQPVPENLVVNRTTNTHAFTSPDDTPVENPADLLGLVGSVQESPRYLSTHFGAYHPGGEEVALHLAVPEGTPALYLGTISVDPSQHELLLGRGLSFQIDRVWVERSWLGGDTWHVQAHILPEHPAEQDTSGGSPQTRPLNRVTRPLTEAAPEEPFRLAAPAGHFGGFTVTPGDGPHLATEPYLVYPEVFTDPTDITPADWESWLRDLTDCMTQRDPTTGAYTEWMLALHQSDDGWRPIIYRGDLFSVQPPEDTVLLIHTHIIGSPEGRVPSAGDWLALRNSGLSHGYVLTYSASDAAPGENRMRILRIGYEGPPADGQLGQEVFPRDLQVPEPVNDYTSSLQRAEQAREAIAAGSDIARRAAAELDAASQGFAGIFGRTAVPEGLDALRGALARVSASVDNPAQAEAALAELGRFTAPDQRLWTLARQELRAALSHVQATFYGAEEQTRVSLSRDDPVTRARAEDVFNYVRSLRFGTSGGPLVDRAMEEDDAVDKAGLTVPRYRDALARLTSDVVGRAALELPDTPELPRLRAELSGGEPLGVAASRLVVDVQAHGFDSLDPARQAQYHALVHILDAWHGFLTEDPAGPIRDAQVRAWVPEGDHFLVELFDGEHASLMRADRVGSGWVFSSPDDSGDLPRCMASAVPPTETVVNLFGHADAEGILIGRTRVPFAELGAKLLDLPEGSTIRLYGCEAGAGTRVSELARVTGRDVVAADTPVWVDRNGNVIASHQADLNGQPAPSTGQNGHGDGTWRVFHPDGSSKPLTSSDPEHPGVFSPAAGDEFLKLAYGEPFDKNSIFGPKSAKELGITPEVRDLAGESGFVEQESRSQETRTGLRYEPELMKTINKTLALFAENTVGDGARRWLTHFFGDDKTTTLGRYTEVLDRQEGSRTELRATRDQYNRDRASENKSPLNDRSILNKLRRNRVGYRSFTHVVAETAALHDNVYLGESEPRLGSGGLNVSEWDKMALHGIPVDKQQQFSRRAGHTHLDLRPAADYPAFAKFFEDKRQLFINNGHGTGADFDKSFANGLLELFRGGPQSGGLHAPDIWQLDSHAQPLLKLAGDVHGQLSLEDFQRRMAGSDPMSAFQQTDVGKFLRRAASLAVLNISIEGARHPENFLTSLMVWSLAARGPIRLDDALGYFNLMGPDGATSATKYADWQDRVSPWAQKSELSGGWKEAMPTQYVDGVPDITDSIPANAEEMRRRAREIIGMYAQSHDSLSDFSRAFSGPDPMAEVIRDLRAPLSDTVRGQVETEVNAAAGQARGAVSEGMPGSEPPPVDERLRATLGEINATIEAFANPPDGKGTPYTQAELVQMRDTFSSLLSGAFDSPRDNLTQALHAALRDKLTATLGEVDQGIASWPMVKAQLPDVLREALAAPEVRERMRAVESAVLKEALRELLPARRRDGLFLDILREAAEEVRWASPRTEQHNTAMQHLVDELFKEMDWAPVSPERLLRSAHPSGDGVRIATPGDPILGAHIQPISVKDAYVLEIHGVDGQLFFNGNPVDLSVTDLPEKLRAMGWDGAKPIVLASCEAGAAKGAAGLLADALPGTGVIATRALVFRDVKGNVIAASVDENTTVNGRPQPTLIEQDGHLVGNGVWELHKAGVEPVELPPGHPLNPTKPELISRTAEFFALAGRDTQRGMDEDPRHNPILEVLTGHEPTAGSPHQRPETGLVAGVDRLATQDDFGPLDTNKQQQVPSVEHRPQRTYALADSRDPLTTGQSQRIARAHAAMQTILDQAAAAGRPLTANEVRSAIALMNPTGSKSNCVESSMAVDDLLRGHAAIPGPSVAQSLPEERRALVASRHASYRPNVSLGQVEAELLTAGPGARGIINILPPGGMYHAYNIANIGGQIYYIDAQNNRMLTHNPYGGGQHDFYRTA